MTEIDITSFVSNEDPFEFSRSIAEYGTDAGPSGWRNATKQGKDSPLLTTSKHLDALRHWAKDTGAWSEQETSAWSKAECNALFIQLISGDMREIGLDDPDEFDWDAYEADENTHHNIYRDADGKVWYTLY